MQRTAIQSLKSPSPNITEYHPASDNYFITYQDGNLEVMSHSNILKCLRGTKQYEDYHENQKALYSAFHTAVSSTTSQSDTVPENYKDARATSDVADSGWMKAYDIEMGKLRSLGCWEVLPRSSLPQNASVMKIQWTFRYKKKELGNLKSVSNRLRFVAKGYSQVQGLHYFENYAPVASFITLRLLFALTSIPNFQVLQYDVSVAFIQSKLDSNYPPVYCECAEGHEDRRKYVYRLHRHLYGMEDSSRGWGQLFASGYTDFGLTRLKSDECVFVKFVNNSNTRIQNVQHNPAHITEATAHVPENDRIYSGCPDTRLIIASYVDDNIAFTNCAALAAKFQVHCNVKFPMNSDGPVNWYLSVKYDPDPITGAVSAPSTSTLTNC